MIYKWSRKQKSSITGQASSYIYENLDDNTLSVTRFPNKDFTGEPFKRELHIGDTLISLKGKVMVMSGLGTGGENGYYFPVRKADNESQDLPNLSAALQIDKMYMDRESFADHQSAQEVSERLSYTEGAVKQVMVNTYERDQKGRKACIEHHGAVCFVCQFDFGKVYGLHGQGFIEVHHIKPLHEIRQSYVMNPITDLVPLCSNCHSMVHRTKPGLTVEQLKQLLS